MVFCKVFCNKYVNAGMKLTVYVSYILAARSTFEQNRKNNMKIVLMMSKDMVKDVVAFF